MIVLKNTKSRPQQEEVVVVPEAAEEEEEVAVGKIDTMNQIEVFEPDLEEEIVIVNKLQQIEAVDRTEANEVPIEEEEAAATIIMNNMRTTITMRMKK